MMEVIISAYPSSRRREPLLSFQQLQKPTYLFVGIVSFDLDPNRRIRRFYLVRNPDKLGHLNQTFLNRTLKKQSWQVAL